MSERFYADAKAVRGRAGIFDRVKGNRLVAYFPADPGNGDAAARMARVCADALNTVVMRSNAKQGSLYEQE